MTGGGASRVRFGLVGIGRAPATWAEDTVSAVIALAGVAALYWDGWRHHAEVIRDDNFWSPPHIALYTALGAMGLWIGSMVLRRQPSPEAGITIPGGYGLGIVGLVLGGVGGVGDFIWHGAFGFEDQADAFWSPPHQTLFYAGALLATAPFVSSWRRRSDRLDVAAAVPVALSLPAMMGMATFVLMYFSPLWHNVVPTPAFQAEIAGLPDAFPPGFDLPDGQVGIDAAVRIFGDGRFPYYVYSLNLSVAGFLLLSLTLTAAVLLLVRRWRIPPGTITVVFGLYGLVYIIPTAFRTSVHVVTMLVAGLLLDGVVAVLRPWSPDRPWQYRAVGASVPFVAISCILVELAVGPGLAWHISVWLGVLITSTMAGLALACLMNLPRGADG